MTEGQSSSWRFSLAAIFGATAVGLGAWHAHGLSDFLTGAGMSEEVLPKRLDQFETGVKYQFYHALALLALATGSIPNSAARVFWPFLLLALGTLIFSGSLYLLVFLNLPVMGAITPIGGVLQIAGWLALAVVAFRRSK